MASRSYTFDGLTFYSLRDLRSLRLLTQSELARAVGVCLDSVVNWEMGHRKPQMRHRKRLARALGIPVPLLYELLHLGPQPAGASAA
jgi:DNA-binding XRE family transcriptional regulator